jgi:ribosomal protein S6--L-glutamate ligase
MRTLQLLAARGIPIVPTALARSAADVRHAVERLGGTPCVVKLADGTHGKGVMLAESVTAAESIVGALVSVHRHLLLQEYIPYDHDLRLIVLGRKVIAAMRRRPRDGNFRANLHQGGVGEPHLPTATQTEMALAAAHALGLEFAGVDLLETPYGPLVLEINASPGLEGIEGASGCNVALAVIRLIETRVREKAPVA